MWLELARASAASLPSPPPQPDAASTANSTQPFINSERMDLARHMGEMAVGLGRALSGSYRSVADADDWSERLPSWSSNVKSAVIEIGRVDPSPQTVQKTPGCAEPNPNSSP